MTDNKAALDALETLDDCLVGSFEEERAAIRKALTEHQATKAAMNDDVQGAFEKWFFEYRAALRTHNITLDSNDANSAFSGFEAGWYTALQSPAVPMEVVEEKASLCRQNRPANYTHGYVCGYLDGVSSLEKALLGWKE